MPIPTGMPSLTLTQSSCGRHALLDGTGGGGGAHLALVCRPSCTACRQHIMCSVCTVDESFNHGVTDVLLQRAMTCCHQAPSLPCQVELER